MFLAPLCNPGVTEDSTQNKSSSFTAMEFAACVLALSRRNLSFVEFAGEFCGLAAVTEMHDAAILHLFRLGASYHHPMDLPDTTGLCWREGIYRCLGSFWSRVGTSSSSSPRAPPSSSPSFPLVPSSSALPERPRGAARAPPRRCAARAPPRRCAVRAPSSAGSSAASSGAGSSPVSSRESQSPRTRHSSQNGRRPGGLLSCPVSVSREASRAPTPPPRWMVYGAGRTVREGGVMSGLCSLCLVFPLLSCP